FSSSALQLFSSSALQLFSSSALQLFSSSALQLFSIFAQPAQFTMHVSVFLTLIFPSFKACKGVHLSMWEEF
ncbi:hypothetical protein, partial [Pantoea coffeiphila]|uniref:hypothetical protein n=1 Tax=Pantoea coffeiphila TaxID=1465635 RepID=UPI00196144CC